jgi:hypothetical protein
MQLDFETQMEHGLGWTQKKKVGETPTSLSKLK